jgi:hypothetical protein
MNTETLEALKQSIKHWERLYKGETSTDENTGTSHCPLCKLFSNRKKDGPPCSLKCPIKKKTKRSYCEGSPYQSSSDFWLGKDDSSFQIQAKIFHDWLVDLLPTK